MKTLYLLRHAKSSWDHSGVSDRDRPLNNRGQRDAPRMGAALAQQIEPVAPCVSPACRAQQTLEGVCQGWPALADLGHDTVEELYTFSADGVQDWITGCGYDASSLFIIGHNPALTDLSNRLVGYPVLDNLPTAGFMRFSVVIDSWEQLRPGLAELTLALFPKDLPPS